VNLTLDSCSTVLKGGMTYGNTSLVPYQNLNKGIFTTDLLLQFEHPLDLISFFENL